MKSTFKLFTIDSMVILGLIAPALVFADGTRALGDPIVSWDRIEGTIILPDETPMQVGPYFLGRGRFRVAVKVK